MKESKRPPIVNFAIFTVVITLSWVFFTIYRSLTQKPTEVVPEELLTPLNSKLDQKTLDQIKQRFFTEEENIPDTSVLIPEPTPTESTIVLPTQTPKATLENTPTASPSASL